MSLRKLLLESCSLHTVLDCPGGTFQGAGVKTVVLFFDKGTKTRRIWYYQLDPGRPEEIGYIFAGFQKYLYQPEA